MNYSSNSRDPYNLASVKQEMRSPKKQQNFDFSSYFQAMKQESQPQPKQELDFSSYFQVLKQEAQPQQQQKLSDYISVNSSLNNSSLSVNNSLNSSLGNSSSLNSSFNSSSSNQFSNLYYDYYSGFQNTQQHQQQQLSSYLSSYNYLAGSYANNSFYFDPYSQGYQPLVNQQQQQQPVNPVVTEEFEPILFNILMDAPEVGQIAT